jgi:hypothetical protein
MEAHNATHAATNEPKKRLVMKKPPKNENKGTTKQSSKRWSTASKNSQITVP